MFLQSLPSLASAVFVDKFSLFYDTVTRAGLRSPVCYLESFNYPAGGCWLPVTGYLCAARVKVRPPWRNSGGNLSSKNPISQSVHSMQCLLHAHCLYQIEGDRSTPAQRLLSTWLQPHSQIPPPKNLQIQSVNPKSK